MFKTDEEFNAAKDEILEKIVMWELHREMCAQPIRLTFEDIAILWAPDKDHVMSKMGVCKIEQRALAKLKTGLSKHGINSLDDVFDNGSWRTIGCSESAC